MLTDYVPILVTLLVAMAVAAGVVAISVLLGPKRPTAAKLAPYESGMVPVGMAWRRFPIKFYLTAMLFVIFDIEIIFFFPWAVVLRDMKRAGLGLFALVELSIFVFLLLLGYVYVLKKGALEWD